MSYRKGSESINQKKYLEYIKIFGSKRQKYNFDLGGGRMLKETYTELHNDNAGLTDKAGTSNRKSGGYESGGMILQYGQNIKGTLIDLVAIIQ